MNQIVLHVLTTVTIISFIYICGVVLEIEKRHVNCVNKASEGIYLDGCEPFVSKKLWRKDEKK